MPGPDGHECTLAGQGVPGVPTILSKCLWLQFLLSHSYWRKRKFYLLEVAGVTFQLPAPRGALSPLLRKQLRPIVLLLASLLVHGADCPKSPRKVLSGSQHLALCKPSQTTTLPDTQNVCGDRKVALPPSTPFSSLINSEGRVCCGSYSRLRQPRGV